jgi:hypothetical protein
MKPFSYYKQYSLRGIKRNKRKPSKEDLPPTFVDLMERMGYEFSDYNEWVNGCIGISRGCGTDYIARFDFKQGIFIAKEDERLGRITTLKLEELPMRNICFQIPETPGGGQMKYQSDINERIPKFRDYLTECSFVIATKSGRPEVSKQFSKKHCAELWGGCIEIFPHEPWGEELIRLCKDYNTE